MRVANVRSVGVAVFVTGIVGLASACSDSDEASPSTKTTTNGDAAVTGEGDAAILDGGNDSGEAKRTSSIEKCGVAATLVVGDGATIPWNDLEPLTGEACPEIGASYIDGCKCGLRCGCTAHGWACSELAC